MNEKEIKSAGWGGPRTKKTQGTDERQNRKKTYNHKINGWNAGGDRPKHKKVFQSVNC